MNKTVKFGELPGLTRNQMVHTILVGRNNVGKTAKKTAKTAATVFKSQAPVKTGALRSSPSIEYSVGQAKVVIADGELSRRAWYTNKYGKHKGWLRKLSTKQGRNFYTAARGVLK